MKSYYQHLKSTQEFGETVNTPKKPILRSSGVFPVIHNQYYSSSLHFVGYWLIKSNTPETLFVTLRNADGKTLLKKTEIIDGPKNIKPYDVVIGLPSIGLHTNGYSLIRKLYNETKMKNASFNIYLT